MKTDYWKDRPDLIDAFSQIDAIDFTYNDEAHQLYGEELGVDNDEHVGIKAQDLQNNPATPSVVQQDDNGFLSVDTKELTMSNTAVLSEVCKAIIEIQNMLGIKSNLKEDSNTLSDGRLKNINAPKNAFGDEAFEIPKYEKGWLGRLKRHGEFEPEVPFLDKNDETYKLHNKSTEQLNKLAKPILKINDDYEELKNRKYKMDEPQPHILEYEENPEMVEKFYSDIINALNNGTDDEKRKAIATINAIQQIRDESIPFATVNVLADPNRLKRLIYTGVPWTEVFNMSDDDKRIQQMKDEEYRKVAEPYRKANLDTSKGQQARAEFEPYRYTGISL